MKKVFIVDECVSSKQNGVGTYMKCLLSCLVPLEIEVNLLSFNSNNKRFEFQIKDSIRYIYFPICHKGSFLEIGSLCWPLLRLYFTDVTDNIFIINHSPCVDLLRQLRKQFKKARLIFIIHDQGWTSPLLGNKERLKNTIINRNHKGKKNKIENFVKKYFKQEQIMYKLVDDIVCLSTSTHSLLTNTYNIKSDKIHLIPNSIYNVPICLNNEERLTLRKNLGFAEDDIVLLYVGRTVEAKGFDNLLLAFEKLSKNNSRLRLIVAGEIFRLNEFAQITKYSATRITYLGLIAKEQLQKWYNIADFGLLPSYTEQCSYTGIEMMAQKLLIVTTNGNGLSDMFTDKINAIVCPISDDMALSLECGISRAMQLSTNEKLQMQNEALNLVRTKYSLHNFQTSYRRILLENK